MMDQVGRQPILIMYTLGYNEVDPALRDSDVDPRVRVDFKMTSPFYAINFSVMVFVKNNRYSPSHLSFIATF